MFVMTLLLYIIIVVAGYNYNYGQETIIIGCSTISEYFWRGCFAWSSIVHVHSLSAQEFPSLETMEFPQFGNYGVSPVWKLWSPAVPKPGNEPGFQVTTSTSNS